MINRARSLRILLATLLALLVALGCRSSSTQEAALLHATTWILEELEEDRALSGVEVTLRLDAGNRLYGFGGVNQYFGSYAHDGSRFRTRRVASTRMAGPVDAREQELRLLALLDLSDELRIEDGLLKLEAGGRALLVFRARR